MGVNLEMPKNVIRRNSLKYRMKQWHAGRDSNPRPLYIPHGPVCGSTTRERTSVEGRRPDPEAWSSNLREAPSPDLVSSNGFQRQRSSARPRMHKEEYRDRLRDSRPSCSRRRGMRFVGIDLASETHVAECRSLNATEQSIEHDNRSNRKRIAGLFSKRRPVDQACMPRM